MNVLSGETTIANSYENNKGLVFSLGAHVVLFLFIFVRAFVFDSEPIDFQSAIRIDLVALPDKDLTSPESKQAVEVAKIDPQPEVEVPKEVDTPKEALPDKVIVDDTAIKLEAKKKKDQDLKKKIEEKKEDKKKKAALDRIKKLSALESIKSSVETERIEKIVGQAEAKAKLYKGNILNPGTELAGINKIQHENYVSLIDRQIKDNWTVPQWMAKKDFKAQALLKIDHNGTIIYNQIYKTSGNAGYDEVVLDTIKKSGPFPKPPEKFSAILAEKGVLIGFPE